MGQTTTDNMTFNGISEVNVSAGKDRLFTYIGQVLQRVSGKGRGLVEGVKD